MSDVIKYGDEIVLKNLYNNGSDYLAVYWWEGHTPEPWLLAERIPLGKYAPTDYVWKIVPAEGSSKKIGDPVPAAEPFNLVVTDHAGVQRYLAAMSETLNISQDPRVVAVDNRALYLPHAVMAAAVTKLDGTVAASGADFVNPLEYGEGCYVELRINAQFKLWAPPATSDHQVVVLQPGDQVSDMSVWWHIERAPGADSGTTGGQPGGQTGGSPQYNPNGTYRSTDGTFTLTITNSTPGGQFGGTYTAQGAPHGAQTFTVSGQWRYAGSKASPGTAHQAVAFVAVCSSEDANSWLYVIEDAWTGHMTPQGNLSLTGVRGYIDAQGEQQLHGLGTWDFNKTTG